MSDSVSAAQSGYRYWGFISYSHADRAEAEWLHRAIERYRLPKSVIGKVTEAGEVPRRLAPIFRDADELAGSSDLGEELREALAAARTLIVVCSPNAVASQWVNEEIRTFSASGRADRIFCVIVRGEPHAADPANECFPSALEDEPFACDLREGAEPRSDARLRLVAGMVGLGFDDLKRRDRQRRIRRTIGGAFAVAALAAGFTAVGSYGLRQRAANDARTLAAASVAATDQDLDPVTGLELAMQAAERAQTDEVAGALRLALDHQLSLVILQHDTTVNDASFSVDARRVLTCGDERTARVWDVATGGVALELTGTAPRIRTCTFSPDLATLLTAGDDEASIWDAETGERIAGLEGHSDAIATATYSMDGSTIVTAAADGTARLWDARSGAALATFAVTDEPLRAAFLFADGARLLTIDMLGRCAIWDVQSGARLSEFGELMTGVHTALLSPQRNLLLVSNYQYRPYLWDLSGPTLIDGVMAMPHAAGAAFTSDGSEVAIGSGDGFVAVFDTREASRIKQLQHPDLTSSMAFSPSGHILVTAADRIRIWQRPVLGGGVDNPLGVLRGHAGSSWIAMFAPGDDERLLTVGEDRTVRVWDLSPWAREAQPDTASESVEELLERARARLPVRGFVDARQ